MTPQQLVSQNVFANVSSLISTLAAGAYLDVHLTRHHDHGSEQELRSLFASAAELAAPVDDWETAAYEIGWTKTPEGWWWREPKEDEEADFYFLGSGPFVRVDSAQAACDIDHEPAYQEEPAQFWQVSLRLADKLDAHGEKVDKDFAGLIIWARTTAGQAVYADSVIEAIAAEVSL